MTEALFEATWEIPEIKDFGRSHTLFRNGTPSGFGIHRDEMDGSYYLTKGDQIEGGFPSPFDATLCAMQVWAESHGYART